MIDGSPRRTAIPSRNASQPAPQPSASEQPTRQTLLFGSVSPVTRYNAITAVCGDAFWGFQAALWAGSTVLTVLLQKLGATGGTIGIVGAIESGGLVLPQIIGAYVLHFRRNRKVRLMTCHMVLVLPPIWLMGVLIFFSPRLSPAFVSLGLLVGYAMIMCGLGLITPPWINWMADLFGPEVRGRVVGLCMGASATLGILGTLLAGELIRTDPRPVGFARNYFLAGTLATVSLLIFMRVRDEHTDGLAASAPPRSEMAKHFFESLRDLNFRAFLIGRMLATLGFSILPFIVIHFTGQAGGGLSASTVVHAAAAQAAATAIGYYAVGRLGDTRGHRLGMIVCCVMQVAALAIMLLTRGPVSCVLAYSAAGLAIGSGGIAQFNLLLETCPHESRVAHITAANLVHSAVAIAAPLVGGIVAQFWGTQMLFSISLPLSVAALAWFVLRLREPRETVRSAAAMR